MIVQLTGDYSLTTMPSIDVINTLLRCVRGELLYDYISIHSNDYSLKLKSGVLEKFIINLGFEKVSHLKFIKDINGERIKVTGILADLEGCYSFDTLDGIEEINLIEIDLPLYVDDDLGQVISKIAIDIAKGFSWIIDEDHGLFKRETLV